MKLEEEFPDVLWGPSIPTAPNLRGRPLVVFGTIFHLDLVTDSPVKRPITGLPASVPRTASEFRGPCPGTRGLPGLLVLCGQSIGRATVLRAMPARKPSPLLTLNRPASVPVLS